MTTAANNLPFHQDIMAEIFKRLPIASLVRFSSVSKSLYCLIHSRSFIAVHLAHQKSSSLTRYISGGYLNSGPYMGGFLIHDQKFSSSYTELWHPWSLPTQCYHFVGSCAGLVCLKYGKNLGETGGDICLWNPSIHKVKVLPRCQNQFRMVRDYNVGLAFGFHRDSLDYKVVRFVYFKRYNYTRKFCVEVYSLNSNSWKRVIDGVNCESALSVDGVSSVSMNGVAYWLATKDRDIKSSPQTVDLIASFDMGSEKLSEISLPDSVSGSPWHCISIANLRESLALLHLRRNADIGCEHDIWILHGSTCRSKHSWTKKFSIFLHSHSSSFFRLVPAKLGLTREQMISFSKDGRAVMLPVDYDMHSYDLESKQVTRLGFCHHLLRPVDSFLESLVLLGIRNSILLDYLSHIGRTQLL